MCHLCFLHQHCKWKNQMAQNLRCCLSMMNLILSSTLRIFLMNNECEIEDLIGVPGELFYKFTRVDENIKCHGINLP